MENRNEKMVIQLLIGKQAFPITIKRDQEEIYRRASQLINEKLGRYEQSYPHLGYEKYTSVALLDFAVQVLQLQAQQDQSPYESTGNRRTAGRKIAHTTIGQASLRTTMPCLPLPYIKKFNDTARGSDKTCRANH